MWALIVVDMQRDFMPGGSVPVSGAGALVPVINDLMEQAAARGCLVVITQDWHPPDHVSFFTTAHRAGAAAPANTVRLFPPHCVAGSPGAELAPGLTAAARVAHHVVRKGQRPEAESLSAFYDADRRSSGLSEWLRARNVADVAVAGVATELCVRATALDAAQDGFGVAALVDCVGAAQPAAGAAALGEVAARGGRLLRSAEWLAELPLPPSP